MDDEGTGNWYTHLTTNEGDLEFFSSTLAKVKKYLLDWLIQTKPTYLKIGGEPRVTCEKTRGGSRVRIHSQRTILTDVDDKTFYEAIIPWVFTQTGPAYVETLLDPNEKKICLERVKTIAKLDEIDMVNLMIRRGWYLLSLERHSEKIMYIMGHEEHEAF